MRRAALALLLLGAAPQESRKYVEPALTEKDRNHWAFRALGRPEPPAVKDESRVRTALDRFVQARLEKAGLESLPEADPATLLRRVTFDLTGLPPTPDELASPDPYEKHVDRLLASPAYGERWAQFWLDQARFAETDGFEHDKLRPDAWKYRDWVIAALNADVPFDRFARLQLAADLVEPAEAVATGFLMSGPDMPDLNAQDERRHNVLNEMASTVGQVFLGLTIGCAQCHDHKYDPVSIADFYRLRAVFSNVVRPERDKPLGMIAKEKPGKEGEDVLYFRGEVRKPGPAVEAGLPRIANPTGSPSGRRTAFVEALARADHPLFTRVAANWLWQHHFGRGIAATPADFGSQGSRPSDPLLLDWLAAELPRLGWSLKAMHRLIVTSTVYRRASRPAGPDDLLWARAREKDPDNLLLWRRERRRLEGEAIRDAMLALSGRLSERRGGPGTVPPLPPEITVTLLKDQWKVSPDAEDHRRRSVYLFARRNLRHPIFEVFDRPSADAPAARRDRSTTAPQSLMMLNSPFSLETAAALAARIENAGDRVGLAYRLALGRDPRPGEREAARAFLRTQPSADFCLALLNVSEFVYID